jgi:pyridoxine kinase
MARILSISSQVLHGHVGNSVTAFVLQRLGHDVISVPAILLSNRPDYSSVSAIRIPTGVLAEMLEALLANGWLDDADAIMTGYLPTAAHVALCASWVQRLKLGKKPIYVCDPVMGDHPGGLYIDAEAAAAVRDLLLPLACIATPNRFELGWLTGRPIETYEDAMEAAKSLKLPVAVATSAPAKVAGSLSNILVNLKDYSSTTVAQRHVLAHGTGDFFTAAFLSRLLEGGTPDCALSFATSAMECVLEASAGLKELNLITSQSTWVGAPQWPTDTLPWPEKARLTS